MNLNPQIHWNQDDLLDRLYGLDPRSGLDPAHLDACSECGKAWMTVSRKRDALVGKFAAGNNAQEERLRTQRSVVLNRVARHWAAPLWRMVPAGAMALVLVAAVMLHRPTPEPVETAQVLQPAAVSDAELFSEAATMADLDGTRTTGTIQALFDANSEVEVQ
jgi:hypothetical protein